MDEEYLRHRTGVKETVMVSFHVFVKKKNKHRAVNFGNTGI